MKKLLILFSIFPMITYCQIPDTKVTDKFSIGLTFSPDYCYRTLKADASSKWIAEIRDTMEIGKFGLTTGFSFHYKINKHINIETGLQYSDKGAKTKPDVLLLEHPDPTLPNTISYIYSYRYLDIPIKFNYFILTGKFQLYVSAGLSTNIFLSKQTTTIQEFEDGTTNKGSSNKTINEYSKVNFAYVGGFGLDYNLSNKLQIRLEPIYRRSIISIIDGSIKDYLWSVGLNTGLYYKF